MIAPLAFVIVRNGPGAAMVGLLATVPIRAEDSAPRDAIHVLKDERPQRRQIMIDSRDG